MLATSAKVWSTASDVTGKHSSIAGGLNCCFICIGKGDVSGAWILSYKKPYTGGRGGGGEVSILILVKIIQLQNSLRAEV